jgi:hypothetical protein
MGSESIIQPERKEVVVTLPNGWLTAKEAEALAELARGRKVLELGAFQGRSTVAMACTAKLVVSVDWHQGDAHTRGQNTLEPSLDKYKANIAPYENILPLIGRFEQVVPMLDACTFDMVFVDGQHDFLSVLRDMMYALNFRPQIIAVHDWGLFHVTPAISLFGMVPTQIVETLAVFDASNVKARA